VAQGQLARVRIEVEELAVALPVDGDLQLPRGILLREAPSQQVEERALGEVFSSALQIERTRRARFLALWAKISFASEMLAATNVRPSG
jgi:hypothetical protein